MHILLVWGKTAASDVAGHYSIGLVRRVFIGAGLLDAMGILEYFYRVLGKCISYLLA